MSVLAIRLADLAEVSALSYVPGMPPDQYPDDARRMLDLIARFSDRLPPDRLECTNDWVVHREWVWAFEILCDELYDDVALGSEELAALAEVGRWIGVDDPTCWQVLDTPPPRPHLPPPPKPHRAPGPFGFVPRPVQQDQ